MLTHAIVLVRDGLVYLFLQKNLYYSIKGVFALILFFSPTETYLRTDFYDDLNLSKLHAKRELQTCISQVNDNCSLNTGLIQAYQIWFIKIKIYRRHPRLLNSTQFIVKVSFSMAWGLAKKVELAKTPLIKLQWRDFFAAFQKQV